MYYDALWISKLSPFDSTPTKLLHWTLWPDQWIGIVAISLAKRFGHIWKPSIGIFNRLQPASPKLTRVRWWLTIRFERWPRSGDGNESRLDQACDTPIACRLRILGERKV